MSSQTTLAQLPVGQIGFGAMRITGVGIWGPPRDEGEAIVLLRRNDLADMLCRMRELEADALAMPAGRKAPALDDGHFVRHIGVRRIMRVV